MDNRPSRTPDPNPTKYHLFQIHREEIKRMYLDDNMTFSEVKEHMERKGLKAG